MVKSEIKKIEDIFDKINQCHGKHAEIKKDGTKYTLRAYFIAELQDGLVFKKYKNHGEFSFDEKTVNIDDLINARINFNAILNNKIKQRR